MPNIEIDLRDVKAIEKIAKKYNMTTVQFGRAIIAQTKVRNERQYRVSEEEFEEISEKAMSCGSNRMSYSEDACRRFLEKVNNGEVSPVNIKMEIGFTRYGYSRAKRITVRFGDKKVERELVEITEEVGIDMGSLIRYCALNY